MTEFTEHLLHAKCCSKIAASVLPLNSLCWPCERSTTRAPHMNRMLLSPFCRRGNFFLHFLTDQKWGWQFWGPLGSISVGWVFRLPCWSPMAILNLQCAREKDGRREGKGGRGEQESIQRERDEGGGGRGGVWSRPTASCLETRTQDRLGRPTGGGHMCAPFHVRSSRCFF